MLTIPGYTTTEQLYEIGTLLTGQLPFQTPDAMELIHCHLAQHPVPLNEIDQNIPKPVSAPEVCRV